MKADANQDGQVTASEIQAFVAEYVPRLTEGLQVPTFRGRIWSLILGCGKTSFIKMKQITVICFLLEWGSAGVNGRSWWYRQGIVEVN
ncbi:MAG: hypothetical protein R2824_27185 [Saprospiraceae bacterium]